MNKKYRFRKIGIILLNVITLFVMLASNIAAQVSVPDESEPTEDFTWWYATLALWVFALAGTLFWWLKKRKTTVNSTVSRSSAAVARSKTSVDNNSLDADKELEWLRRNQNSVDKRRKKNVSANVLKSNENEFQTSIKYTQTDNTPLPVFSFQGLEKAKPFTLLSLSNDESLLSAVEQTHDEYEEDEELRDLAVRILTAFRTRNSVEALSQVALYDLSSNLRSKAVSTLADFNHESVFETILLACADPTREVRAAAARGFSRLSFDRTDAWARIAETGEEGRIRQAARAAMEAGFVERSFDRLVHTDRQNAYEAFVVLAMLLKVGETDQIFAALKNHKDLNVKLALLHLFKVTKDQDVLEELYTLLEDKRLPKKIRDEVDKTIEEIGFVTAA